MDNETRVTEDAGQAFSVAYTAHNQRVDLQSALILYRGIISALASTPAAGSLRSRLQDIVTERIPVQALLDDQLKLALDHLKAMKKLDAGPTERSSASLLRHHSPIGSSHPVEFI